MDRSTTNAYCATTNETESDLMTPNILFLVLSERCCNIYGKDKLTVLREVMRTIQEESTGSGRNMASISEVPNEASKKREVNDLPYFMF